MEDNYSNIKVLIADDSDLIREFHQFILKSLGIKNIVVAINGDEAVRIIYNCNDINFIVCDYTMPGANGIDVLKLVRSKLYNIPFIMVTSEDNVKEEALKNGVTEYINKPLSIKEVKSKFKQVLDTYITYNTPLNVYSHNVAIAI